ncbi:hypothetical protein CK203_052648 [Vitis vinifera]|uniref:Retrotransposon gag domain-containing protein n=1 Tax=Vitis vinifera TaxID=29760 RepID=A0A438GHE3_VITVI|nr:hypothetical protein CK203_052648 [Vitis vinifera]
MGPTILRSHHALSTAYDARYWQRCIIMQVFPASLQGQALSWFHRLPPNSVDNFRDLSEAFVGQYLCSARHKQNISTLQNIKMKDNESLREFVKRFGQAVLQIEGCPTSGGLDPRNGPSIRDRSKKCVFHKDHGHTTETCRSLQYLVERLIKAGHLKQYLRSDTGGRDASQHHNSGAPRAPVAPKAVINYINEGPSDEEYDSRRKRQKLLRAASIRERINSIRPGLTGEGPCPIDGTIIFPPVDPTPNVQPHRGALILSLEIGDFDSRGSRKPRTNLIRIQRIINNILRDIILPVRAGQSLSTCNSRGTRVVTLQCHLGRTWLHYMKAIPSTYHQMVSFLTNEEQTDLYGSQLAARQ